ncbi:MAG: hypothetical protein AB7Q00_14795 [Phycisphaerales bacterium]
MHIILEGPDGSGKSTLAVFLSHHLGVEVTHSGGPSKYPGEVNERAKRLMAMPGTVIFDRHPCISQNIYNSALRRADAEMVSTSTIGAFYASKPLLIYCRPTTALRDHRLSEFAPDQSHNDAVEANYDMLLTYYDLWAKTHANIIHRIGDDPWRILANIRGILNPKFDQFDPFGDVEAFHNKFGVGYHGPPRALPLDLQDFRELFIREEFEEYQQACSNLYMELHESTFDSHYDDVRVRDFLEKALDALVDLTYVVLGTAQLHGFNFREAWKRVQDANMKKIKKRTKRGNSEHDIGKPEGWRAPSHADLVRNHAHLQRAGGRVEVVTEKR